MGRADAREPEGGDGVVVVGVGASAGGLEALQRFLGALPPEVDVAVLVQQHLKPDQESHLADLLASATELPVETARDGATVQPGRVYVAPAGGILEVHGGDIRITPLDERQPRLASIDRFFTSLARDAGSRAMGVVLSGTGSDGTAGLREIQGAGGITFSQDPTTAAYPAMPESARNAGVADLVLSPADIAARIAGLRQQTYLSTGTDARATGGEWDAIDRLYQILRSATGVDLSLYKSGTLHRRILRRMALQKVPDLDAYVERLRRDPAEVRALHQDVLISVTSFFRDPEAYRALREHVLPKLLHDRPHDRPLRIWVAGCSTGEEVYSVAMTVLEHLGDEVVPMQVFGTDVNDANIQVARAGRYEQAAADQVPPDLLRRYFVSTPDGYQVNKRLRSVCVFSTHNLYQDPPFSNIDLVTCRNVLIYLRKEPQRDVLAAFHYALREGGFLLLGTSESPGALTDSFRAVDQKNSLYVRRDVPTPVLNFFFHPRAPTTPPAAPAPAEGPDSVERTLVEHYVPAGVVVDERGDVTRFLGRTGDYLEHRAGAADMNLFRMARPGLEVELRAVVAEARKRHAPASLRGIRWQDDGRARLLDLEAIPVLGTTQERYVVTFRAREDALADEEGDASPSVVQRLEEELERTRAQVRDTVEQYEVATEELRVTNEQALTVNEELQSTNEELQTTSEELQSANEELTVLNDELQVRINELHDTNGDLVNLLASVRQPIVFLSPDLRVRRFTPDARRVMGLEDGDLGRPLSSLRTRIPTEGLVEHVREVLETLSTRESEVQDTDGRWHRLRVQPYRTPDGRIEGAVLVLVDIDEMVRTEQELRRSNRDLDHFAAFASHEIREPLRNVQQSLQLAVDPERDPEAARQDLQHALAAMDRITGLVKSILRFAQVGSRDLEVESLELERVVEDVRASLAKTLDEADARVEVEGALPAVAGDPSLLGEVFSNLVLNAVQYRGDEDPRVVVHATRGDGEVHVRVSDNGTGIRPELQEKVFGLFQRGTSNGRRGLGIGLALCRRIVDAHGGRIWVESVPDQGSTFHFTLPAPQDTGTEAPALPPNAQG